MGKITQDDLKVSIDVPGLGIVRCIPYSVSSTDPRKLGMASKSMEEKIKDMIPDFIREPRLR